jgi:hypothetical protein
LTTHQTLDHFDFSYMNKWPFRKAPSLYIGTSSAYFLIWLLERLVVKVVVWLDPERGVCFLGVEEEEVEPRADADRVKRLDEFEVVSVGVDFCDAIGYSFESDSGDFFPSLLERLLDGKDDVEKSGLNSCEIGEGSSAWGVSSLS